MKEKKISTRQRFVIATRSLEEGRRNIKLIDGKSQRASLILKPLDVAILNLARAYTAHLEEEQA